MDDLDATFDVEADPLEPETSAEETADWDLLHGFRNAGDSEALERLFVRYRDSLFSFALRMLRSSEDAEDVTTEAFYLMCTRASVGRKGSFRSFAFTVVRRMCLDRIRKRTVRTRVHRHLRLVGHGPQRDPENQVVLSERLDALEVALGRLLPGHREVLLLYYTHGLSSGEVGEVLGMSAQQVRSKLSYARRLLRDALDEEGAP